MAQWFRKTRWFELHWQERRELAIKVLRDIEDEWLRSDDPFPTREAVAVLLNIFAFDAYSTGLCGYRGIPLSELWRRQAAAWFSAVGSPESECDQLSPQRDERERSEVIESLCASLQDAASSWEHTGPDQPSCDEVVQQAIDVLVSRRFVVVKYD